MCRARGGRLTEKAVAYRDGSGGLGVVEGGVPTAGHHLRRPRQTAVTELCFAASRGEKGVRPAASRWIVPNRAHLARSVYVNRVGAGGCLREMKELALRRNYWVIGLRLKFDVKNLVNQSYVKNIIIDLASQI